MIARGKTMSPRRARSIIRQQPPQPGRAAPKPPWRCARGTFGHRDRALAARSLYDLRQAHLAAEAARSGRTPNPARAAAAPSSTARSGNSRKFAASLRPIRLASCSRSAKRFSELEDFPEARAFWWPRFERIAHWFANWEIERRGDVATIDAEIMGKHEIKLGK